MKRRQEWFMIYKEIVAAELLTKDHKIFTVRDTLLFCTFDDLLKKNNGL